MAWRAAAASVGFRAVLGACRRGSSGAASCGAAAAPPPLAAHGRRRAACARAAAASSGATRLQLGSGRSRCGSCAARLSATAAQRRRLSASPAAAPAAAAPAAAPAAGAAAEQPHVSVLLDEVLEAFEGLQVRRYVDGTLGAGGHASAVLRAHPELSALVGFDLDPTAHALASARLAAAGAAVVPVAVSPAGVAALGAAPPAAAEGAAQQQQQATAFLVRSNFGRMRQVLQQLPLGAAGGGSSGGDGGSGPAVDAILLDLGISSMQVDTADRGFSFLRDGPLDMRMDPAAPLSAELAVNSWPEAELGRVIREYGEERHWRSIARRIVAAREEASITTTQQLVAAIGNPGGGGRGGGRGGRGKGGDAKYKHPATRTFQALRIAVNGELQSIAKAIPDAIDCLAPGGRLAVITFHSLEDRIVKWAFRAAAGMAPSDEPLPSYCLPFEAAEAQARIQILTRRPRVPSDAEQAANVRSRSAKLRVVQKL